MSMHGLNNLINNNVQLQRLENINNVRHQRQRQQQQQQQHQQQRKTSTTTTTKLYVLFNIRIIQPKIREYYSHPYLRLVIARLYRFSFLLVLLFSWFSSFSPKACEPNLCLALGFYISHPQHIF